MAKHAISLEFSKEIEVLNSDIVVVVRKDAEKLGTLTLSKGSIDWRPKNARPGSKAETQLSWAKFAELMESANTP
jgi:hypothetical protein